MSDATDANQLRVARDQVIGCINEVTNIYDHLSSLPIDESQRSHYSVLHEDVETKHNQFLCQVSQRIYDLKMEVESRGSVRSSHQTFQGTPKLQRKQPRSLQNLNTLTRKQNRVRN